MTEQQAISKVIATANGEVGYREGAGNWNKYAAELDPLGLTYGNKQTAPWCGEWVLWVFYRCFGADKALEMLCSPKPTSIPLCSAGAKYFKDAGRWSAKPSLGAVVFFNVDGGINHTGIVTGVSYSYVTTVEGNSSDMVSRHSYAIGSSTIAGYGLPKWDVAAEKTAEIPVSDSPSISGLPVLRYGDKGETVRAAQFLLNGRDCYVGIWGADGDFGSATRAAVEAFQRRNSLDPDGVIGEKTWAKLLGVS